NSLYNTGTPLAPLTDTEKELLRVHQGCFKCQTFYGEHIGHNCTNPHPSADDCKKVMAAHTAKAKVAYEKKKQGTTTIAAVLESASIFEDEASNEGSDEYMDANETKEYVHPSLSLPSHLYWMCCVNAPATCAPTPIKALIDHGSPPVLISSELAEILCLTPRLLFKPISVSGAFSKEDSNICMPLILTQYCRLLVQLTDAIWKSHAVNAIIVPNLHTDLILGLDLLVKNKIVVDAHLCSAIAKESGYDLLNPPDPKRPDLIGAIKTRIKQLAGEAMLQKWDRKLKETFADHFPNNIPHVKDLPRDVFHYIKLLPGAPISVAHAYACPCKYHAGWKALIKQHKAAGCMRPSFSPYASPSFIIPKADPTILP
ncbi:hypothetical protein L208DRAFT_1347147, partial [Tricholoma matsutake]